MPANILKIIAKQIGLSAADSFSTAVLTGSPYSVGNMASAAIKSLEEIKEYTKQTNDALYHIQVKTFLETADLEQSEVEGFLEKNPNNIRLGLEVFKILESTVVDKQAIFIAKAFRKFVIGSINELKLNEYFHVIQQLDKHTIYQIETDLEQYKAHSRNGLFGLPTMDNAGSIAQFISLSAPASYVFQKIGFVGTRPKEQLMTLSGSIKPETIYERTSLYLDFYLDLILSD